MAAVFRAALRALGAGDSSSVVVAVAFLAARLRVGLGSSAGGVSTVSSLAFLTARLRAGLAGASASPVVWRSFSSCVFFLIRWGKWWGGWRLFAKGVGDIVGDFEVGEDVDRVRVVVELVVEFEDLPGEGEIGQCGGGLREGDEFFGGDGESGLAEVGGDVGEFGG